jgi:hypothetical protein
MATKEQLDTQFTLMDCELIDGELIDGHSLHSLIEVKVWKILDKIRECDATVAWEIATKTANNILQTLCEKK